MSSETDKDLLSHNLPLGKVLPWVGLMIIAVAGGTYKLTHLSMSDTVAALKTTTETQSQKIEELSHKNGARTLTVGLSEKTLDKSAQTQKLSEVTQKVRALEKERSALLSQLNELSKESLKPESELSNLLTQLDSEEEERRRRAVQGLFELGDPRAVQSLVNFFLTRSERELDRHNIFEWIDAIWLMDSQAGVEFAIRLLEGSDGHFAYAGFRALREDVRSNELIDIARQSLEIVATGSQSTLVRTRAKLLLTTYEERKIEITNAGTMDGALKEKRSLFGVLHDIEKDVKKLLKVEEE